MVEPGRVDRRVAERVARGQRAQEAGVRGEPEDAGVVEGRHQRATGALPVGAVDDDLAQHRVERRADHLAGLEGVVDPHAGARARPRPPHDRGGPGLRQEPAERVLGVDPRLHRVPVDAQVVLGERQRLARRDAELVLDEVDAAADQLRDRVLDLEAGVHLEEVEVAGVGVEQELHGARVGVADRGGQGDRRRGEPLAQPGVDGRRGRLLDDLLVAALRRAVALEEVQHRAVLVGEHLHLDVAAVLDVLLQQQGVVAERARCLAAGGQHRLGVRLGRAHDPHALAAATRRGLDQDGIGELVAHGHAGVGHGVRRHDRHAGRDGDLAGGVLAPHLLHHLGARPDQHQPGLLDRGREGGPLGEEAVARVDRLRAAVDGCGDDRVDVEVRRHPDRLVGGPHVRRGRVGVGEDRDRADAEAGAGAHHAQRDLAAVGDQDTSRTAGVHRGQTSSGRCRRRGRRPGRARSRRGPCRARGGSRRGRSRRRPRAGPSSSRASPGRRTAPGCRP